MSRRREWQQGRVGSGCEGELRRQLQDKDELLRQMEKSMRRSMSAVHRGTPAPPSVPVPRSAPPPPPATPTEPEEAAAAAAAATTASAYGSNDDVVLRVVSELHSLRQLVSDVIGVSRDEQAARSAENVVGRLEVLEQASRTQELRAKALEDRVAELERKSTAVAAASPPPPPAASSGGFLPPGFLDPLEGRVEALERLADEDGEASAAAAALSLSRLTTLEHASGILADKLEGAEAAQEGLAAQQGKVEEALATLYNLQKRTEKAVAAAATTASSAAAPTIRTGTPPPAAARATRPQARRTPPTTPKVAVEAVVREQQGSGGGGASLSLPVPSTPLPASPSAAHLNATPHSTRSIVSVSRTGGRQQQQQRQQHPTSAGAAAAATSDDDGLAGRFTIALSTGEFVVGV